MQSTIRNFMLALAVVAVASLTQTVQAQTNYGSRVQVPFAFDYGNQHFYPGTYTMSMLNNDVLAISGGGRTGFTIIRREIDMNQESAGGYLLFRKYGDRYFLAEYHPGDTATWLNTSVSRTERNLEHELATRQSDSGRVRLALLGNEMAVPAGR
ncbi:MAG TPA: hypothetical protein VHX37_14950 [Acidobacteriaceae bacterium]|jgi:hypothetical protein|nr:hypothetical protein [Acidobacteriaceae bacterium]